MIGYGAGDLNPPFDMNGIFMLRNLQAMSVWQRRLVFFLIFGGGLLGLVAITLLLITVSLNGEARVTSVSLVPSVIVRQFAALPDDDAYPAAVAAAPDGTVYTGSFASGTVWQITSEGEVSEIPSTRDALGAVVGLAVEPDGSLLVIDQRDTDPRTAGGQLIRIADDAISIIAEVGFIAPNDLALDAQGRIYMSDSGANGVWRFDPDGANGSIWWVSPAEGDKQPLSPGGIRPHHRLDPGHRPGTERHLSRRGHRWRERSPLPSRRPR
ncbi:MAG: hypothetical protein LC121_14050 [Anaerolineae bacterium]|nr:hypothetical protein [Anaerolineae bacterium]